MGAAVLVGAPGIWLIKRRGRTLAGRKIEIELKPLHRGNITGGVLFGSGGRWRACVPGPILVNIGEGKVYALAALAGARWLAPGLRHDLPANAEAVALPALKVGTGEG